MKRLVYCVIIAMSISLAFSGGKPCCNKKAGKNTVSCKFNQAKIANDTGDTDKLTAKEAIDGNQRLSKCCFDTGNQCAKGTNKPWWKFWVKKSSQNCPCKQTTSIEASATN